MGFLVFYQGAFAFRAQGNHTDFGSKVVFNEMPTMLAAVCDYYLDPAAIEKRYRENAVNKDLFDAPVKYSPKFLISSQTNI